MPLSLYLPPLSLLLLPPTPGSLESAGLALLKILYIFLSVFLRQRHSDSNFLQHLAAVKAKEENALQPDRLASPPTPPEGFVGS